MQKNVVLSSKSEEEFDRMAGCFDVYRRRMLKIYVVTPRIFLKRDGQSQCDISLKREELVVK